MLQAQIYTTSSASVRSYSTGVCSHTPVVSFKSTSAYVQNQIVPANSSYATAPIQVSNGVIRTVASSLNGGKFLDSAHLVDALKIYLNRSYQDRRNTMAPPSEDDGGTEEFLPLSLDWDAALLLAILLCIYAFFIAHKQKNVEKV